MIRSAIGNFEQTPFPAMDELAAVVADEVTFQEALWNHDYTTALSSARTILGKLKHQDLRGYRALWHYLAGAAAMQLSSRPGDAQSQAAHEQFASAKRAAPSVSWLNTISRTAGGGAESEDEKQSTEALKQVEALEQQFLSMGTATNQKFEKYAAKVQSDLANVETFEAAQVGLGTMLGFTAGNDETDAAPDPWWLGEKIGVVFESHADGKVTTPFGATKARQASSHPKWIKKNVAGTEAMEISPILVTPCTKAKSGADPQLDNVRYWELNNFRVWAARAIAVLRELKGAFPGEGDLIWRAETLQRLETEGLTLEMILRSCPMATDVMEIVE